VDYPRAMEFGLAIKAPKKEIPRYFFFARALTKNLGKFKDAKSEDKWILIFGYNEMLEVFFWKNFKISRFSNIFI
jgi:hypothetical protein